MRCLFIEADASRFSVSFRQACMTPPREN